MHSDILERVNGLAVASAAVVLLLTVTTSGQVSTGQTKTSPTPSSPAASNWKAPRTPDGHPDLQGVWSYASGVPLERFDPSAPKRTTQDEDEADAVVGNYSAKVWMEIGQNNGGRTSLIIDPPNGRIPPLTAEAEKRWQAMVEARRGLAREEPMRGGWIESLGPTQLKVRCILGFNSGPPMTPGGYNQNVQIYQVPGYVVLAPEMIHDARIVPMDGRPHGKIRQWLGDSRGRWDGDTLVVDTVNFRSAPIAAGGALNEDWHLIERFTRTSEDTVLYEFTVSDPATWTKPWTAQIPLTFTKDHMYEYACHEGNYGLPDILAGARAKEKAEEDAGRKSAK
jgi:hypothetical protein